MNLFLDDIREPLECAKYMYLRGVDCTIYHKPWHIVKSYYEFTVWLAYYKLPDIISFDYDLHENFKLRSEYPLHHWFNEETDKPYTGLDCAKYLIDYCKINNFEIPKCVIHSFNVDGTEELKKFLNI